MPAESGLEPSWQGTVAFEELEEGVPRRVLVGVRPVVLVRRGAEVHAVDAVCPHKYGPLEEGTVEAGRLRCPLHEAVFDLATGEPSEAWAGRLPVFAARVVDGVVEVALSG